MQKQIWLLSVQNAFYKIVKAKSQRIIIIIIIIIIITTTILWKKKLKIPYSYRFALIDFKITCALILPVAFLYLCRSHR